MALNYSREKQHRQKFGSAIDHDSPESYSVTKDKETLNNIDGWARQIVFWRTHLDVFIEDVFTDEEHIVKFYPFQAVKIREIGNCEYVVDDEARGLGKTYIAAWASIGLCVLYPGYRIVCVSGSGKQSTLILQNIERIYQGYKNVQREIKEIKIQMDKGQIRFKNGSEVVAMAMGSKGDGIRGQRTKLVFIDEGLLVKTRPISDSVKPTGNWTRPIVQELRLRGYVDYEDIPSKVVELSSGCLKFADHFTRFKNTFSDMLAGKNSFACALTYDLGLYHRILSESVIEEAKRNSTKESFAMEYMCRFIGTASDGVYPYELVMGCRTAQTVELEQPEKRGTKHRYILSADVATSARKGSDNAVISILKFSERRDGTFFKRLVFMRSYNGLDLKDLATEIRKLCILFPSVERVIVDINGLGEGVVSFLELPYVDEATNKEYPSFVSYDVDCSSIDAIPIVYPYRGTNEMNNRGTMALKMFMENETLILPVNYLSIKDGLSSEGKTRRIRLQESAIYRDVDALMFELTNIRSYTTTNSVKYGVRKGLHKDRYSSLMMACYYLYELEQSNKREKISTSNSVKSCGVMLNF